MIITYLKSIFSKIEEICLIIKASTVLFSNTNDDSCVSSILQALKEGKDRIPVVKDSSVFFLNLACIDIDEYKVVLARKEELSFREELKEFFNNYFNLEVAFKGFNEIILKIITDFLFKFGFKVAQVLIEEENRIIDNILIEKDIQSLSIMDYSEFYDLTKRYNFKRKRVNLIDINRISFLAYNINKKFFESRGFIFNKCLYFVLPGSFFPTVHVFVYENISEDYKRFESLRKIEDFISIYEVYAIYLKNVYALYRAEKIKLNFVVLLNHELRTPLNSILGYSQMLSSYSKDPEIREALNEIQMAGKDLLIKIERMILFQELKFDLYVIRLQNINLKNIVEKVIENLISVKFKKITIETSLENWKVRTDPNLLYHLLFSFVDNAVKFTSGDKIIVESIKYNGFYGIRIKDEGPGFKLDKNCFKEFSQIECNIMTRKVGGLGIGLTIAYEISRKTNICFNIRSVINEGTEVLVYIKN